MDLFLLFSKQDSRYKFRNYDLCSSLHKTPIDLISFSRPLRSSFSDKPIAEQTQNKTIQYFAIWAMFMSSVVASKVNYGVVTDKVQSASSIGYIMIASSVLIIAILFVSNYNWRNLYSLTVAVVSTLLCSLLVFMESKGSESAKKIKLPILSIMAVLWLFVVIFCKYSDFLCVG